MASQPLEHSQAIQLLIVEDEPIFRQGLEFALKPFSELVELIGVAGNADDAVAFVQKHAPQLILVDLRLPRRSGLGSPSIEHGISVIERVSALKIPPRVLVLSYLKDSDAVFQAIKAGAHGYIAKDDRYHGKELVAAIQAVAGGDPIYGPAVARLMEKHFSGQDADERPPAEKLTPREKQVLSLLALGKSDKELAEELVITLATVKTHVRNILAKLHLRSRHQVPLYSSFQQGKTNSSSAFRPPT